MDNITHSLVGVALADLSIGRTSKAQRSLFVGAGIIAANLPDIDLAYAAITPSPLGYLLHHRGHTHTVLGLAGLAVALLLAYWFFPAVRKMRFSGRLRFWLLIAIALASHLALDALNSYGVHPFYPVDNTWYFGDAVFILEPWLWLLLGIAAAWNGRSGTARLAVALPMALLLAAAARIGAIPLEAVALLAVGGGIFAWAAFGLSPRARAAWGLAICVVIIGSFIGASRVARRGRGSRAAPGAARIGDRRHSHAESRVARLLVCDRRRASRDGRRVCAVAGNAVAGSGVDTTDGVRIASARGLAGEPDPRRWTVCVARHALAVADASPQAC